MISVSVLTPESNLGLKQVDAYRMVRNQAAAENCWRKDQIYMRLNVLNFCHGIYEQCEEILAQNYYSNSAFFNLVIFALILVHSSLSTTQIFFQISSRSLVVCFNTGPKPIVVNSFSPMSTWNLVISFRINLIKLPSWLRKLSPALIELCNPLVSCLFMHSCDQNYLIATLVIKSDPLMLAVREYLEKRNLFKCI